MMIVVPKIGESNIIINPLVLDVIDTKVEIQMTTKNLEVSWTKCLNVIHNLSMHKDLDEIVVHMPFSLHTFELYASSIEHQKILKQFIRWVEDCSRVYSIKIGILMHQEASLELIETIPRGLDVIMEILDYIYSKDVYFLVENCLPCLNSFDNSRIPAFDLLNVVKHEKLLSCIDVCHARCYEFVLKKPFIIPESIVHRVQWIHFANVLDCDGYRDKKTHGRKHGGVFQIERDLEFLRLRSIDIDAIPIVTEISEDDYKACPDMLEEISFLHSIR